MGPDARCAAGLLCESGAERVHTHPQRILHLMVGDRAPFGLSCGGDAAAGWENQAGVEINGAPHCEHSVRAGAGCAEFGGCAHTISDPLILSHKVNDFSQSLPSGTITIREVQ